MTDQTTYEQIEQYLHNKMSVAEKAEFENKLKNDPDLQTEVEFVRQADEMIILSGLLETEKKIKAWKPQQSGFNNYYILSIIIGFILISGFITWHLFNPESINTVSSKPETTFNEKIAEKNEFKPKNEIIVYSPSPEKNQVGNISTNSTSTTKSDILNIAAKDTLISLVNTSIISTPIINENIKDKDDTTTFNSFTTICNAVTINPEVTINAACLNEPNGSIIIQNISGGKEPYQFSINSGKYSRLTTFSGLQAGNYELSIQDSNGCLGKKIIEVYEKDCSENEFAFAPSSGQVFKFPLKESEKASIKIFNNQGQIIYQSEIKYGDSWNGIDRYGLLMPVDSYLFIINFENGYILQGNITITSY